MFAKWEGVDCRNKRTENITFVKPPWPEIIIVWKFLTTTKREVGCQGLVGVEDSSFSTYLLSLITSPSTSFLSQRENLERTGKGRMID